MEKRDSGERPNGFLHNKRQMPERTAASSAEMVSGRFFEKELPQQSEVICGVDTGYFRSNPDQIKDLLDRSLTEGGVRVDSDTQTTELLDRVTALSTHFGITEIKTQTRRDPTNDSVVPVEAYRTQTEIELDNDPDAFSNHLKITIQGPIDREQLPSQSEQRNILGKLLPEPTIEISLKKKKADDVEEGISLKYGADGTAKVTKWTDGFDGYQETVLTQEEATGYLQDLLPNIIDDDGVPSLDNGRNIPNSDMIADFSRNLRLERLDSAKEAYVKAKRDTFGYDAVMYLPENYYAEHSSEGEFLSLDYPAPFIPEDVLETPEVSARVQEIAEIYDSPDADSVASLLEALPGGKSDVMLLVDKNGDTLPVKKRVPTILLDKAARYFLQYPEEAVETVRACDALSAEFRNLVGREPMDFSKITAMHGAMRDGLLGKEGKDHFLSIINPLFGEGKLDMTNEAVAQAYQDLHHIGETLRDQVYSQEEKELIAKAN